jgi:hypothetical protein
VSATVWRRFQPGPRLVLGMAAVLLLETAALGAYLATTNDAVTAPRYLLYPVVWINAGLLAVWWVRRDGMPSTGGWSRRRTAAAALGAGYFLVLAWIAGAIARAHVTGVDVHWGLPPGWGPIVVAGLGPVRIAPIPYRIAGYAALAYLVYRTVLDAEASPVSALVGAFSCVSCTLPLLALVLSTALGGAAGVATTTAYSYDLATLVYLAALGLLAWRPDVAVLRRVR